MEELIVLLIQFFFEVIINVILNVLTYFPFDTGSYRRAEASDNKVRAAEMFWTFLAGALVAALSLILFHYALIKIPALRILNLILLPVISAYVFEFRAERRSRTTMGIVPRVHFWRAFWFTLGFVCVRFAFTGQWGDHCQLDPDTTFFFCRHF